MKITIYQNREVYKEESKIGNDSENKVETLEFEFPEEYKDFTKYIEFQIKGGKYVDLIEDNKYVITREVAKYGKIKTQVVLKKNTENDVMVFKSDIFTLTVSNSINATENLVYTVGVDLIEKIVTKNNEQDARLDTLEADNTTNKENISNIQEEQTTQNNRLDSLEVDNTANKSDISNIKQEQITQNTNIQELQTDNTSNKAKIETLETKNTEQDTNIQKNTNEIKTINEKNKSQDTEITNIKSEQVTQNTNIQNNTEEIEAINKKDTTQDKLIAELQTENAKLKKTIESMQILGEATGNPIHLTDSSDMKCEIVVKGNAEQETRTDNLMDNIWEQGLITAETGTDTDSTTMIRSAFTEVHPNHLYNISRSIYNSYMSYRFYDKDKNFLGTQLTEGMMTSSLSDGRMNANESSMTFTITNTNVAYMRITDASNDLSTIYTLTTEAINPDYPSEIVTVGQNGSVEIEVCNKNWFDKNNINKLVGYVDGNGNFNTDKPNTRTLYISCMANTDYVVSRVAGQFFRIASFSGEIKNGVHMINGITNKPTASKLSINTGDNAKYLAVTYYNSSNDTLTEQEILNSIQIELGSEATDYIPHQSYTKVLPIQKEFVKIGDYEDTFVKQDGKWYEAHYHPKIVFDGTENIIKGSNTNQFYITKPSNILENSSLLSTHFVNKETATENGIWVSTSLLNINILNFTDVDSLKNWLDEQYTNGVPVAIYPTLKEPELIPCTAEQSTILNSFYTYKGITNISVDGIATLKVNYKKDLETLFNNINSALLS